MSDVIRSVERAFALLELLAGSDDPVGVCELATAAKLPQSTAHRLLMVLVKLGYVSQEPLSRRYMLGLRMLNLHGSVLRHTNLGIQAMPVMKALAARVDETVHLAVLHEGEILYIDRVEGLHSPPNMYTYIGKRVPAHCTALGKAILSCLPHDTVMEVLARRGMRRMTPNTLTSPEAFVQELERTRQRGYAIDNEEIEEGTRCIAAPIWDYANAVCAAVSISGHKTRIRADREMELSKSVLWARDLISAKLGYLGHP